MTSAETAGTDSGFLADLHEDDFRVGPRTFTDRPSPTGTGW